jgi:hypothetical protein
MSWSGLDNRLLRAHVRDGRLETFELLRLALGPTDNVEGLTAEPLAGGRTRLWLMTDNDFSSQRRTLLIALDMTPENRLS